MLGTARRVIVDKDNTTIIEGGGTVAALKQRIAQITNQAENAASEYEKENYENVARHLTAKLPLLRWVVQLKLKLKKRSSALTTLLQL